MSDLVNIKMLEQGWSVVKESDLCFRTPLLQDAHRWFPNDKDTKLYLKLENMQNTGSFKIRGLVVQLLKLPDALIEEVKSGNKQLVTMSAGNYGKTFAYGLSRMGLKGHVLMPLSAPATRRTIIKNYGMEVETLATVDLQPTVDRYVHEKGMKYLHSFDDIDLVAGHSSLGFEILQDVPEPDVVVVCCGGGGLLSGVASAIKLSGKTDCRVYGVEPTGANTMYESFKTGRPVFLSKPPDTIAVGLAPPYAGKTTYAICKEYVTDILLVTDEEILKAMQALFTMGLVVEPSGCAAMAAYMSGKIPDIQDKKCVVVLTGGNVTPEEVGVVLKS